MIAGGSGGAFAPTGVFLGREGRGCKRIILPPPASKYLDLLKHRKKTTYRLYYSWDLNLNGKFIKIKNDTYNTYYPNHFTIIDYIQKLSFISQLTFSVYNLILYAIVWLSKYCSQLKFVVYKWIKYTRIVVLNIYTYICVMNCSS